jgi:diaminopimelate epimerase
MKINFLKMHGLGNDFVMIDDLEDNIENYKDLAIKLCDRHFGIGADGIILIKNTNLDNADFKMRIFNPDGSEAEMCGNGIRCFAHFLHLNDLSDKNKLDIETLAGIIKPEIINYGDDDSKVRVNMGKPNYSLKSMNIDESLIELNQDKLENYPLIIDGKKYMINTVSMGNPHTIIYVDNLDKIDLKNIGPIIEKNPLFKNKTNVEFVKIIDKETIDVKVWERGAGATLACGTGACAAAAVSIDQNKVDKDIKVNLPGGQLKITKTNNNEMMMTGPSTFVFKGEIITGGIK